MKISEAIDMKGRLFLRLENRAGEVVETFEADNAIVLSGRDLVVKLFANLGGQPISHIAVGTGAATVNAETDTKLVAEVARKAIKPIVPDQHIATVGTGANSRRRLLVSTDLDFNDGNAALTEAGIFNAATGGVMYNRVTFQPINKTKDFKLTLVWEILF